MSKIADSIQSTAKAVLWIGFAVLAIRTWQDPASTADAATNFVGTFFSKLGEFAEGLTKK